jgi:hypothetical protein
MLPPALRKEPGGFGVLPEMEKLAKFRKVY